MKKRFRFAAAFEGGKGIKLSETPKKCDCSFKVMEFLIAVKWRKKIKLFVGCSKNEIIFAAPLKGRVFWRINF